MHAERIPAQHPDQVAYRAGGHWLFAAIATVLGIAFLHGTATRLVLDWPQHAWEYGGGVVLCLAFTAWAAALAAVREVVLNRRVGRASVMTRWFGVRRHRSFDIGDAVEVRRQKVGGVEVPDSYLVSLGKSGGTALELVELSSADDAAGIAAEIAQHLRLPVVYYIGDVKVSGGDAAPSRA